MTAVNTGERFLYTGECLGSLLLFERIRSTDGGCSGKSLSSCVIGVVLGFVVATTFWSAPTHALGTINWSRHRKARLVLPGHSTTKHHSLGEERSGVKSEFKRKVNVCRDLIGVKRWDVACDYMIWLDCDWRRVAKLIKFQTKEFSSVGNGRRRMWNLTANLLDARKAADAG